jgi:hypothetical protein
MGGNQRWNRARWARWATTHSWGLRNENQQQVGQSYDMNAAQLAAAAAFLIKLDKRKIAAILAASSHGEISRSYCMMEYGGKNNAAAAGAERIGIR